VEFGLLLCREQLIPFYERLGWEPVTALVFSDQPAGKMAFAGAAMVLPCSGRTWPAGIVDLCGLPF
jgi:aminoglycoside 2'-N-acetyltransferase I